MLTNFFDVIHLHQQLFVLAGSACPTRPCLRVLTSKKQKLKPFADFSDKSVRNTIVRAAIFDQKNDAFFTGSEEGFHCLWKPGMLKCDVIK